MAIMPPFTHTRYFFALFGHHFRGEEKEDQTAEMVKGSIISDRIAFLGGARNNDVVQIFHIRGEFFHDFRTSRNVILQTAIPGSRQSLGAPKGAVDYFARLSIMSLVEENRKIRIIRNG